MPINWKSFPLFREVLVGFIIFVFYGFVCPPDPAEAAKEVGQFISVSGEVEVLRDGKDPALQVMTGNPVMEKDMIRTKSRSRAVIRFVDGNTLAIDQRSRVDISEYITEKDIFKGDIRLPYGKVEAAVDPRVVQKISQAKGNRFEIRTPTGVAGVRGTTFSVMTTETGDTEVYVSDGIVVVSLPGYPGVTITVPAGQKLVIPQGATPETFRNLQPSAATDADKTKHQQAATSKTVDAPEAQYTHTPGAGGGGGGGVGSQSR